MIRRQTVSPYVERQPQPGDVYEFARESHTVGGHKYKPGDTLTLIEKTDDAPHGFWNPQGNWRVLSSADKRVSIWSSIHDGIANGWLRLVTKQPEVEPPARFERPEPV